MKISDRTLGYISLVALIGIFAVIAYGMWEAHHEAKTIILVDFPDLGSLQPEDQVTIRGYTVGTIGNVQWLGDRARVQIKFNEPIVIREGTQFNNINYAIMGQRGIEVIPSKTGKVLPTDYVHQGHFEPGLAEALRQIETINEQIAAIRELVLLVIKGDSLHEPASQIFEDLVYSVESALENTEQTLRTLQPAFNSLFRQINDASANITEVSFQADSAIRNVTETVNAKMQFAENALKTISDGAQKTNDLIGKIETNSLYSKVLYSSETVDKVNELVFKLNELVRAIDTKGIKMLDENGNPIKPFTWKNLNIVGKTAREKAKEREKKGEALPE